MSAAELDALWLSLKVAATAVTIALPIAIALAAALTRGPLAARGFLDVIVHLPLVLPPVVVGYLLLVTLGTRAPVGAWLLENLGLRLVFDWKGAALAAAIISLPFQARAIRQAIEGIPVDLLDAAASLGAGPVDRFFSVQLPLALPGIVSGAMMAFAAALGEFGAIITFAANIPGETRTLPLAIYTAIQSPGGDVMAARLTFYSIALAAAGLGLGNWLSHVLHRRLGH